jgi:hypothetical protein
MILDRRPGAGPDAVFSSLRPVTSFHIFSQSDRVIDHDLAPTGPDAPCRRELTERTRHNLAGGAEM